MARVFSFWADGLEEIEALTPVDVLRRAGNEVTTVSIMGRKTIHGSHGIDVTADHLFERIFRTEICSSFPAAVRARRICRHVSRSGRF